MFEEFGFETLTPRLASVYFALAVGMGFGALAQITRFCIRRGLVGPATERRSALGVWMMALITAILGTQAALGLGWIDFADHRLHNGTLPFAAIIIGGIAFGVGMVLTRGCVSRLTVLSGTGNLRAVTVLILFAIAAHATLKGILAPLRTGLGTITAPIGDAASLAALPGGAFFWTGVLLAAAAMLVIRAGARRRDLILAGLIGLLVPLGWIGTGFILFDEFDPIAFESLSFTLPAAETLFWTAASSAVPASFGPGLVGGVILGSLLAAVIRREFNWQSFETPQQTLRYGAGAVLMGVGGVLAGGCTVGAGLSGIPTLSIAALLALASVALGAVGFNAVLSRDTGRIKGAPIPAE